MSRYSRTKPHKEIARNLRKLAKDLRKTQPENFLIRTPPHGRRWVHRREVMFTGEVIKGWQECAIYVEQTACRLELSDL
jgi:hypothetical protein